jgi:ATP-binding cassette subfamily C (CFTR/MRP) protein 1
MSSVERLLQFADIQPEGNASDAMPPKGWIESGSVAFENVTVQYGRKPPVLRGLSFSVRAGEKIGIVGRTGAGKSTIVSSLFRLVECAGGAIRIDGVDISRIRLHELRRSLAIIPQDPVLFVGTLRDNLDPFGEFSSDEVEGVCQRVQLPLDLSSPIEAGGRESGSSCAWVAQCCAKRVSWFWTKPPRRSTLPPTPYCSE